MKAVYFRFINDESKPTGWIGLAVAKDTIDLFWVIDRFGNPHYVEILPIREGGMCVHFEDIDDCDICDDIDSTGLPNPYDSEEAWEKPKWPPMEDIYARY